MGLLNSEMSQTPNGETIINSRFTINALESFSTEFIVKKVIEDLVDKLCSKVLEEKSAVIMSRINITTVANLASIEIGKRAAMVVEKK